MNNSAGANKFLQNGRDRIGSCDIHVGMIYDRTIFISHKCISVFIQGDIVDLLCHGRIIQLDTDHTNELLIKIDRDIIGYDADIQIVCNVRRQPDSLSCRLWDRKPDQCRGVRSVITGDICHLMLLKPFAILINKPETFHV